MVNDVKSADKPLVSVVLSTYNDEKHIKETIESVLNQTYINFEFIIWNDGSTDSTEGIIKSFKDERIRYFYHENTGLGKALSLACNEAQGTYIARIDGDDICLPNRFEREVEYLEYHPNVVLVSSSVIYINEKGEKIGRSYPWTWNRNIKHQLNIVHPAAMFKKEIYISTCGYQDIKSAQDRILWSKMGKYGDFAIIKDPLIKYRWIDSSLSHIIDSTSPYAAILEIIRQKLCFDEIVSPQDIELHNYVYGLAKRDKIQLGGGYQGKLEEKVADIMSNVIGDKIATSIICFLKNIYALIRY